MFGYVPRHRAPGVPISKPRVGRRALALALALVMLTSGLALADQLSADADADALATNHSNSLAASQQAGTSVGYDFSAYIKDTGSGNNDNNVFPGTVNATISRSGDWLAADAGSPSSFSFSAYDANQAGTIWIRVPCDASHGTKRTMTVLLTAAASSNGKSLNPSQQTLSYEITATTPASAKCAPPSDGTPPVISPDVSGTQGNNGWYVSDVFVSWTVSDAESAITSSNGCGPTTISSDTTGTTLTCSATSAGGTNSVSVTVKRDRTAPTVTCDPPLPMFIINEAGAVVSAEVLDGLSGAAATPISAYADTSSVGLKSVNLTGYDLAGNSRTEACSYQVGYTFVGFSAPVNNPSIENKAKAGQAIPLKWRLLDAEGEPISSLGSATVKLVSRTCDLGVTEDAIEEYAAGSSGLQNLGNGYYQFNWKTPTTYASSCKTLKLDLGEGVGYERTAWFRFTR